MQNASRAYLPSQFQQIAPTVQISTDHTFKATSLPASFEFPLERIGPRNFSGQWQITKQNGQEVLLLDCSNCLLNGQRYGFPLYIEHGWRATHLGYFLSDPDNGQEIRFDRAK